MPKSSQGLFTFLLSAIGSYAGAETASSYGGLNMGLMKVSVGLDCEGANIVHAFG